MNKPSWKIRLHGGPRDGQEIDGYVVGDYITLPGKRREPAQRYNYTRYNRATAVRDACQAWLDSNRPDVRITSCKASARDFFTVDVFFSTTLEEFLITVGKFDCLDELPSRLATMFLPPSEGDQMLKFFKGESQ